MTTNNYSIDFVYLIIATEESHTGQTVHTPLFRARVKLIQKHSTVLQTVSNNI